MDSKLCSKVLWLFTILLIIKQYGESIYISFIFLNITASSIINPIDSFYFL